MKVAALFFLLSLSMISLGNPPDTTMNFDHIDLRIPEFKVKGEEHTNGIAMIVSGLLLSSIGIYNEINRAPYPTHPNAIRHAPNAPRTLNYMMIGSGIAFSATGIKLLTIKF